MLACVCTALLSLSCGNDSSSDPPSQSFTLSSPSLFIPAGILKVPRGITVDQSGNVWVADTRNNKIRKFSSSGIQTDSIVNLNQPLRVAFQKWTGDLLIIDNNYDISRFIIPTRSRLPITSLNSFAVDTNSVFDVAAGSRRPMRIDIQALGDIDAAPSGDIMYVSTRGNSQSSVIRIENGNASGYAAMNGSTIGGARFLATDGAGSVFSLFGIDRGPITTTQLHVLYALNLTQSHFAAEPSITANAAGATIDAQGNLYIVEPALQELIVISATTERTIARYAIPSIPGISLIGNAAQDVAVATDGTVYVVVNDTQNTIDGPGAVLKYTRVPQ
jgi:hypothetical protein